MLFSGAVAVASDPIIDILEKNFGEYTGSFSAFDGSTGGCQFRVYKPGEYCSGCNEIYLENMIDLSPAYNLAAYPNNGLVFEWNYDESQNTITIVRDEDRSQYTKFVINQKNKKIMGYELWNHGYSGRCEISN